MSSALLVAGLAFTGTASAVIVDGNIDTNEYEFSKPIGWWNDHRSVYTFERGENAHSWELTDQNPLYYKLSNDGSTLNLAFEVPDYARRMIWEDGCDVNSGGAESGCSADISGTAEKQEVLAAYGLGSHHDPEHMDYKTQTESEFFRLNYSTDNAPIAPEEHAGTKEPNPGSEEGGDFLVQISWTAVDTVDDNFTWATSVEYLVNLLPDSDPNDDCNTTACYRFDKTAAIEVQWTGLAAGVGQAIIDSIDNMQLHLSDEARGLQQGEIPPVPVPAAFWLFGTALIGFIGFSRRTNLS